MTRPPWEDPTDDERPRPDEGEALTRTVENLAEREGITRKEAVKRVYQRMGDE